MSSLLGFRGGKMVGMGAGSTLISFVCSSICILRQTHAHSCDSGHILTLCSLCNEKPYFKQLAMYRLHTCTHTHTTVYTCPLSLRLLSTQNLPPWPSPLPLLSSIPRSQPPSPVKPEALPAPPSSGLMRKQEVWRCPPFSARKEVSHCRVRSVWFRIGLSPCEDVTTQY